MTNDHLLTNLQAIVRLIYTSSCISYGSFVMKDVTYINKSRMMQCVSAIQGNLSRLIFNANYMCLGDEFNEHILSCMDSSLMAGVLVSLVECWAAISNCPLNAVCGAKSRNMNNVCVYVTTYSVPNSPYSNKWYTSPQGVKVSKMNQKGCK